MRNETIAGYVTLVISLGLWYSAGHPTTASLILNGMALGMFSKAVYLDYKKLRSK